MYKIVFICIALSALSLANCEAVTEGTSNEVGVLEAKIDGATLLKAAGSIYLNATFSIEIKNKGSETLRIALVRPFSLHIDDNGTSFDGRPNRAKVRGVELCDNKEQCYRIAEKLDTIAPNQMISINVEIRKEVGNSVVGLGVGESAKFSGILFLVNQGTGKNWSSPLSFKNIPVKWNIH